MSNGAIERVNTLTFDLFGTVLDLAGSLTPRIEAFLAGREVADRRQRILGAVAQPAARRAVSGHAADDGA